MFSKNIVQSARFLKMPFESQNLYFHLCMNADDDGVVEAYPVIKLVGCTEDNLKVLVVKEFARVLNDDLVTYILDWNEHNLLRADRKVDSLYKNLLLEILPKVKLLKPKRRADTKAFTKHRKLDANWTPTGRLSIGEESIGKDSIVEVSKGEGSRPLHKTVKYLITIPQTDVDKFTKEYLVNHIQVREKGETLHDYCKSKGKIYKDYRAFLQGAIRRDYGKRYEA